MFLIINCLIYDDQRGLVKASGDANKYIEWLVSWGSKRMAEITADCWSGFMMKSSWVDDTPSVVLAILDILLIWSEDREIMLSIISLYP